MKTIIAIACLIAVASGYPGEESTKEKRGIFGEYGLGFGHAPLIAPAPIITKTILPAPVITKAILPAPIIPAPIIAKPILPAPIYAKAIIPSYPIGLGHGFGHYGGHFGGHL